MYRETQTIFYKGDKKATIVHDVKIVNGITCFFHFIETDKWYESAKDAFMEAREYLKK